MPDPRLIAYIQSQLQKGYDISSIRNSLINYGYAPSTVEEAISASYQTIKHEHSITTSTLLVFGAVLLGIFLTVFTFIYFSPFTLFTSKADKQLLDINLEEIRTEVKPGEQIIFLKEISNLGADRRYDITVKHELFDSKNNLVYSKEETVAVETRSTSQTKLQLPSTIKPGKYTLRSTALYSNKKAFASLPITILSPSQEYKLPSCDDGIKNQGETGVDCGGPCKSCLEIVEGECPGSCDDKNDCTIDSCSESTSFQCVHDKIAFCCGNNECEEDETIANCPNDCQIAFEEPDLSIFERLENIKNTAASNPDKASAQCSKIESATYKDDCYSNIGKVTRNTAYCDLIRSDRTKDDCFSEVAKASNQNTLCERITLDTRRDSCYMNFVLAGDYSVCDKIVDSYLKDSCNALKQNAELQSQAQTQSQEQQQTAQQEQNQTQS